MPEATPNTRPRVLLDCDPGHDDAMAIIVAARHADLAGITTVAGNAPLPQTTYNARVMRDLLGIDVEIHSGASRPLIAEPHPATFVHGESGLDGAPLPTPSRPLDGIDAVGFIIDRCRAEAGLWLVPTGPLTNVAMALRAAPDVAAQVAGISLMGGGTFGNRSAVAEFNIWADPEAAAIVFTSGVPLRMAGLDVTHQFVVTPARATEVTEIGGPLASVLGPLFHFFAANYISRHDAITGAPLHDPLAVLALTHPALFEVVDRHVAIELTGTQTRGMTVIDHREMTDRPAPNCGVLTRVDDAAAWAIMLDAIRAASDQRTASAS